MVKVVFALGILASMYSCARAPQNSEMTAIAMNDVKEGKDFTIYINASGLVALRSCNGAATVGSQVCDGSDAQASFSLSDYTVKLGFDTGKYSRDVNGELLAKRNLETARKARDEGNHEAAALVPKLEIQVANLTKVNSYISSIKDPAVSLAVSSFDQDYKFLVAPFGSTQLPPDQVLPDVGEPGPDIYRQYFDNISKLVMRIPARAILRTEISETLCSDQGGGWRVATSEDFAKNNLQGRLFQGSNLLDDLVGLASQLNLMTSRVFNWVSGYYNEKASIVWTADNMAVGAVIEISRRPESGSLSSRDVYIPINVPAHEYIPTWNGKPYESLRAVDPNIRWPYLCVHSY